MKKISLMTHIIGGYPDFETSENLIKIMDKSGVVDFIEIQIPFSDPIADGPVIMEANKVALSNGVNTDNCLEFMNKISDQVSAKMLFMTYYNVIHAYGVRAFCAAAKKAGAYGLIVPDMTIEEEATEGYFMACREYGLEPIQIVTPITSDEKLELIGKEASGFVYCMARAGTTGQKTDINSNLLRYLARVRKYIKIPLALGFGISTKAQIAEAQRQADVVVIGSQLIRILQAGGLAAVEEFLGNLRG